MSYRITKWRFSQATAAKKLNNPVQASIALSFGNPNNLHKLNHANYQASQITLNHILCAADAILSDANNKTISYIKGIVLSYIKLVSIYNPKIVTLET